MTKSILKRRPKSETEKYEIEAYKNIWQEILRIFKSKKKTEGVTQVDIAEWFGSHQGDISKYISKKKIPAKHTILRYWDICKDLGWRLDNSKNSE